MKTKLAIIGLGLTLAACHTTPSPTDKAPGTYNETQKSIKANGTEVETNKTTAVYRNADGTKGATVHKSTTVDPEGLMNKRTATETTKNY